MTDRSRWDPEMAANQDAYEREAAKYPPIALTVPLDPSRATNDAINLVWARGGPVMAETRDLWIGARGRRIQCRLHRPRTDAVLPCMVYLHGGGWVWSSIDTHDRVAREFAAAGDVAVLMVDYALSPEAKFPQALEESAAVVDYCAASGASLGIDKTRLLIGGDSAGANLSLAVALMRRDTGASPSLRGVLAVYPVCDADFTRPSYADFATGYGLTRERMEYYWSVYVPHAADRVHPYAAPLHADCTGLPPTLVLLAELDVLRSEGEAMGARLQAVGVPTEVATFPGTVHGFIRATETVTKARQAVAMAGDWLRRVK